MSDSVVETAIFNTLISDENISEENSSSDDSGCHDNDNAKNASTQQQLNDLLDDERIRAEHERLKTKYKCNMSHEMIRKKLLKKRRYFDSADYFRRIQGGGADRLFAETEVPMLHVFARETNNELRKENTQKLTKLKNSTKLETSNTDEEKNENAQVCENSVKEQIDAKRKKYFDSADWSMSLRGLLEYPLGTKPHPVMFCFSQKRVGLAAHPLSQVTDAAVGDICAAADEELRRRYGDALARKGTAQRLKIRLQGKKKRFDSADWALSLQNEM